MKESGTTAHHVSGTTAHTQQANSTCKRTPPELAAAVIVSGMPASCAHGLTREADQQQDNQTLKPHQLISSQPWYLKKHCISCIATAHATPCVRTNNIHHNIHRQLCASLCWFQRPRVHEQQAVLSTTQEPPIPGLLSALCGRAVCHCSTSKKGRACMHARLYAALVSQQQPARCPGPAACRRQPHSCVSALGLCCGPAQ